MGPRTDLVSRFYTSQPRSFGLTFRPRFYLYPGCFQDVRSSKMISEHSDRLTAQNLEAVLGVVVIWAGEPYLHNVVDTG